MKTSPKRDGLQEEVRCLQLPPLYQAGKTPVWGWKWGGRRSGRSLFREERGLDILIWVLGVGDQHRGLGEGKAAN